MSALLSAVLYGREIWALFETEFKVEASGDRVSTVY